MSNEKIKIELTQEEVDLFILFRKYQHIFSLLTERDVFETRNGKVVLNFDSKGKLRLISSDTILYKLPAS